MSKRATKGLLDRQEKVRDKDRVDGMSQQQICGEGSTYHSHQQRESLAGFLEIHPAVFIRNRTPL